MADRLISLNAAIDAVHKNYDTILDFTSDGKTISYSIEDILSELPSATDTNVATTDTISRQAAIKSAHLPVIDDAGYEVIRVDDILALPSAQSELEDKIRAIGYTGKEGRIYIGGRLFAVRELAQ